MIVHACMFARVESSMTDRIRTHGRAQRMARERRRKKQRARKQQAHEARRRQREATAC